MAVPTVTPVTTPPVTEATVELLLDHTPPVTVSVKVWVLPVQITAEAGSNAVGVAPTVATVDAVQPLWV
jgi:hypothetical protein